MRPKNELCHLAISPSQFFLISRKQTICWSGGEAISNQSLPEKYSHDSCSFSVFFFFFLMFVPNFLSLRALVWFILLCVHDPSSLIAVKHAVFVQVCTALHAEKGSSLISVIDVCCRGIISNLIRNLLCEKQNAAQWPHSFLIEKMLLASVTISLHIVS